MTTNVMTAQSCYAVLDVANGRVLAQCKRAIASRILGVLRVPYSAALGVWHKYCRNLPMSPQQ